METTEMVQPMLEAYAERDSEQVFLVPEFCAFVGANHGERKTPGRRMAEVCQIAEQSTSLQLLRAWNLQVDTNPLEVSATIHEPLEGNFSHTCTPRKFLIKKG